MIRPLDHLPPISCDDACHKKRGSLGGTDYAVVVGTPVYAPIAGTARFRVAGTGGWTVTIVGDDRTVELMHLSGAVGLVLGGASRHVTERELVAHSGGRKGAPGSGSATGPHLHAHVIVNGERYGMEEYLHANTPAGGDWEPIEEKEIIMATNWVDTSTYKGGKAADGTVCMTTWEGGPHITYPRVMADAHELAKIMTAQYGPHQELSHVQFEAIRAAFGVANAGGAPAAAQYVLELTGTAKPA